MRGVLDHPIANWVMFGLGMMAFILLAKSGAAYMPEVGVAGAIRKAVLAV